MIIARSPLRISLGGGGTDLASYYEKHSGFVISAAINKYVYINLMQTFHSGILLKYSKTERVKNINEIQHPIIRETLKYFNLKSPKIEITSFAEVPSGTGLGSSGSFATALIKALTLFKKKQLSQIQLAELACHIEIDKLSEPIGKQDQYISVFGGLTSFSFLKNHKVITESVKISENRLYELQENLLLFFTGYSRKASTILHSQNLKSKENDEDMINNLHYIKDLGFQVQKAIIRGNIKLLGELMGEHWENKKKRSSRISNSKIDEWYNLAIKNGAIGGKVIGAGGGGFLMFVAHDRDLLRKTMKKVGLQELHFKFDFEGTKIVMTS
jgi:D-glycero-alpha-D-manno-heptose-7-phosphate kinase